MERQLFTLIYQWLVMVGATHRRGKKQFSDTMIVAVVVWAVLHDRPLVWACREFNWPADRQVVLQLPSPGTMSRPRAGFTPRSSMWTRWSKKLFPPFIRWWKKIKTISKSLARPMLARCART